MLISEEYIQSLQQTALQNFKDHMEMKYIQIESHSKKGIYKGLNEKSIEEYLKKKGYTMNYLLGKPVMVKGFTCVHVTKDVIEVWHDKTNNDKSVFVKESLLTGLPLTLNYMERI